MRRLRRPLRTTNRGDSSHPDTTRRADERDLGRAPVEFVGGSISNGTATAFVRRDERGQRGDGVDHPVADEIVAAECAEVLLMRLMTCRASRPSKRSRTSATGLVAMPDGRVVISSDTDGSVRSWDANTGAFIERRQISDSSISALAVSPNGDYVVASMDTRHRIWRLGNEVVMG